MQTGGGHVPGLVFSKVNVVVIVYSQFSVELAFENFAQTGGGHVPGSDFSNIKSAVIV